MTKVICGFPGIGKTTFSEKNPKAFDVGNGGLADSGFPKNYVQYAQDLICKEYDYILLPSHEDVRSALRSAHIEYHLVYPTIMSKREYLERYKAKGYSEAFLKIIEYNWSRYILDCAEDPSKKRSILRSGQFLSTIL